jgi:hypothetical protein
MDGCMCGCGRSAWGPGWGHGPGFAHRTSREERIERLEQYQRDLEEHVADVADEIRRLKDRPQPTS